MRNFLLVSLFFLPVSTFAHTSGQLEFIVYLSSWLPGNFVQNPELKEEAAAFVGEKLRDLGCKDLEVKAEDGKSADPKVVIPEEKQMKVIAEAKNCFPAVVTFTKRGKMIGPCNPNTEKLVRIPQNYASKFIVEIGTDRVCVPAN